MFLVPFFFVDVFTPVAGQTYFRGLSEFHFSALHILIVSHIFVDVALLSVGAHALVSTEPSLCASILPSLVATLLSFHGVLIFLRFNQHVIFPIIVYQYNKKNPFSNVPDKVSVLNASCVR